MGVYHSAGIAVGFAVDFSELKEKFTEEFKETCKFVKAFDPDTGERLSDKHVVDREEGRYVREEFLGENERRCLSDDGDVLQELEQLLDLNIVPVYYNNSYDDDIDLVIVSPTDLKMNDECIAVDFFFLEKVKASFAALAKRLTKWGISRGALVVHSTMAVCEVAQ